jgi:hypothetical protein
VGRSALPPNDNLVVAIDGGYADWSHRETAERAWLGAAVTRHEFDPTEAVDAQDALMLKAAARVHTRIHALLGGNQLGDAAHYRRWVVAFIRRYGLGGSFWREHPRLPERAYAIRTFELGNEPYFGTMTASGYADTVRPLLEEVKRLDLRAGLVLAANAYGGDASWLEALYERIPNLNALVSGFALHPYWYGHAPARQGPGGPFARIEALRAAMNREGAAKKAILITEYGESTADCGQECVSEAVQARHLLAMLSTVASRPDWGVEMLSVFQLRDRGTHSRDRELQFGLLRQNGTPKPSYAIVHAAIRRYR